MAVKTKSYQDTFINHLINIAIYEGGGNRSRGKGDRLIKMRIRSLHAKEGEHGRPGTGNVGVGPRQGFDDQMDISVLFERNTNTVI